MSRLIWRGTFAMSLVALATCAMTFFDVFAADLNEAYQKAMKEAAAKVAPSVVRIETRGGQEMVVWVDPATKQPIRKVLGPTTGVIVASDGYIISSAFNFTNKPTEITIAIPNHNNKYVAKIVATDHTRMLTLLKIDAKDLAVPVAVPRKDIVQGQWSLALGRSLNPDVNKNTSISKGIISAENRIWSKAIQTDAKISPINYGGPLVSIDGRVQGVLVPASPRGDDDKAGIEWYDSGIGFAIPFEDILAVVPRLKEGKDLKQGLLGITPSSPDMYSVEAKIGTVAPNSAASRTGIQVGDVVVEIDGKPVANQAQLKHILGPKYEGDVVSLKVKRGEKVVAFEKISLGGTGTLVAQGFLGVLPMRDDPEPGVEVRHVFPNSPAEKAKLEPGDRIMKVGPAAAPNPTVAIVGRDQLMQTMASFASGASIKIEVKRKAAKTEVLTVTLANPPEEIIDEIPRPNSHKKALEKPRGVDPKKDPKKEDPKKDDVKKDDKEKEKFETGIIRRKHPVLGNEYWVLVPENYDPNVAHGLIIWLHSSEKQGSDHDEMKFTWRRFCEEHHFIIVAPRSKNKDGWLAGEAEDVLTVVREEISHYTIDKQRVVAHGWGIGGQMAFYLGFAARDVVRGVATVGGVLASPAKDNEPARRLQFFISAGEKDPIFKDVRESAPKLQEKKLPVYFRKLEEQGKEYIDEDPKALDELKRWLDSVDWI